MKELLKDNCKVVVPFDVSDESIHAVKLALSMVDSAEDIHVVHVLTQISPGYPGYVWDAIDDAHRIQHAQQAVKEKLSNISQDLHVAIFIGDAGHEIAAYADNIDAGLIVIPSHGRRGVARILLGSVAERVLRLAHCPVLVLKKPAHEA